jgi:hypothetical protein
MQEYLSINYPKPERLADIDWAKVLETAQICLDEAGEEDSDNAHYLYEAVMEAVYGPSCWGWINQQLS